MKKEDSIVITEIHREISADEEPKSENAQISLPVKPSHFKHNYDLKVGEADEGGNKIEYIYESEPGKYFIYHIGYYDLQIKTEDEKLLGKNPKFNKLLLQIGDYLSNELDLRRIYITHIVYAVKNLLDGNEDAAVDALSATFDNMTRYLKRRTIIPYLLGSFSLVAFSLVIYFAIYLLGNLNDFGHMMFRAVVMASLGGFLSVAISLQNVAVDIQDNYWSKAIHGIIRIMIAMISGVIMYFLIEGKVILAFLKDVQNINAYYIAFFVSGFSEKLVANLLFDFEKKGTVRQSNKDEEK